MSDVKPTDQYPDKVSINTGPPKGEPWIKFKNIERNAHVHHCGPVYYQRRDDKYIMAMRVLPHNMNYAGVIHGGAIMTLADFAMSSAGMRNKNDNITTVQFSCHFVNGVPLGQWIVAEVQSQLKTSLGFHEGKITVNDTVALMFSGVTKRLKRPVEELI